MKTALSPARIRGFLAEQFEGVDRLEQLVEGEESQALSFVAEGNDYVIRINPGIEGFLKDEYAYENFAGPELRVPEVVGVGHIDAAHAYCVSERLPGITFQDAEEAHVTRLLGPVTAVWRAIGTTTVAGTSGYGDFDAEGTGRYETWHDYLRSVLDHDWETAAARIEGSLLDRLAEEFESLVPQCPEERRLVHGDFGSNNLLVDGERVTGVLDWENAGYGDPLLDVAGAYFWRTWLMCCDRSADHWDRELGALPAYRARIRCYQLRTALHEISEAAVDGDVEMLEWLQSRSRQLLAEAL